MLMLWKAADRRERVNFLLLTLLIVVTMAFGGGSREDVLSLPLVYLTALLLIAAAILQADVAELRCVRVPLLLLAALGLLLTLQVAPLPPVIWRLLPGRSDLVSSLDALGLGTEWRPLSLTPDRTLYALVALLPPLAVLLLTPLAGRLVPALVPALLAACAITALVALLQGAGTLPSFYRVTNPGAMVGLFANRNHQAAMLVCAFPLLAVWATWPAGDPAQARARLWIAAVAAATLFPVLLVTGSRAGLLLGLLSALGAVLLAYRAGPMALARGRSIRWAGIVAGGLVLMPIAVVLFFGRGEAWRRVVQGSGSGEARSNFFELYVRMARDFFPWGSGFGSFDPVFRSYEPMYALGPTYLNHAHNDPMEIMIEGGIAATAIMLGLIAWFGSRSAAAWGKRNRETATLAKAGSVMLMVLLAWSAVDYPLRTPSLSILAAFACVFLAQGNEAAVRRPGGAGSRVGNHRPLR